MKLTKNNIVKKYNALCIKHRKLNTTDLSVLNNSELVLFMTGKGCHHRPFSGAYDNANSWIAKGRKEVLETWNQNNKDYF